MYKVGVKREGYEEWPFLLDLSLPTSGWGVKEFAENFALMILYGTKKAVAPPGDGGSLMADVF